MCFNCNDPRCLGYLPSHPVTNPIPTDPLQRPLEPIPSAPFPQRHVCGAPGCPGHLRQFEKCTLHKCHTNPHCPGHINFGETCKLPEPIKCHNNPNCSGHEKLGEICTPSLLIKCMDNPLCPGHHRMGESCDVTKNTFEINPFSLRKR